MNRLCMGLALTLMLAGCSAAGGLGAAADRLDDTTHRFYERLHTEPATGHTAADAAQLAEAAHDFNRTVNHDPSRDYYYRYHRAGFAGVTEAYLDVDRAMNHAGSRYHD